MKPTAELIGLPPPVELETAPIFKALAEANRALGELKGRAVAIPNQVILIDTLVLQEARASSAIENIVTTQDELFRAELFSSRPFSGAAKEVRRYHEALKRGEGRMRRDKGNISNNTLIDMFRHLKLRNDGFRVTPGTALKNETTGEVVYVPPQDANEIVALMGALERFVNEDEVCALDPLIKMALIHHQFESIHPFPDGNGRVGRMLNVLYLVRCGLLDNPILYLSRHINETKGDYYRLLQQVRNTNNSQDAWQAWVLYMLEAVTSTAQATLELVDGMRDQMNSFKHRMRDELANIYSQDLLNNLFRHPYTRTDFVQHDLQVSRPTATKYLNRLAKANFIEKRREGRNTYYVNTELVRLFLAVSGDDDD